MADLMDEAIEISHKLIPCNICGRTFLPSPLKKHAKVCEKNATRKRKTFNSLKQRIEGTELAVFHQKTFLKKGDGCHGVVPHVNTAPLVNVVVAPPVQETRNQSKWKEKHEQLVQAIRAAKSVKDMAPRRSISAVGNMGTTEQCPSCDRHFGPKAYDRHVEWCKEHKIRASKSPAIVTIAKERLEARTKYRVPPLNKSKRSLTRDKYSTTSSSSSVAMNVRSTSSLDNHRKTKQSSEPIIKHHNSEKLKSSNFKYRVYPLIKMNDTDINDSVLDMTVSQMNLLSPPRAPIPPPIIHPPSPHSSKLITWKDQTNTNVSKNKCLPFTVNLVDVDSEPKLNDTIEYIENTENTENTEITEITVLPTILEIEETTTTTPKSPILEEFVEEFRSSTPNNSIEIRNETETSISFDISPVLYETEIIYDNRRENSEFSEEEWQDLEDYTKNSKTGVLDEFLCEKKHNCRLEVEIVAKQKTNKPNKTKKFNLYRVNSSEVVLRGDRCIDHLNKSFSRNRIKHVNIVFINEDSRCSKKRSSRRHNYSDEDLSDHNLTLPPINVKVKKKKRAHSRTSPTRFPPINQSFGNNNKTPLSPLKRSVSLSNPVVKARSMKNKQDIQDYLHVRGHKNHQNHKKLSPRSSDELFPVGHDMYNEYKKYEEMYKREQDYEDSSNEDTSPPQPQARNCKHKPSAAADSAYGSLNRKSPKVAQIPSSRKMKRSPSSSGSDTCTSVPPTAKKNHRLTKFCHECGTKYPLDCAKFCVECGIKRLVL